MEQFINAFGQHLLTKKEYQYISEHQLFLLENTYSITGYIFVDLVSAEMQGIYEKQRIELEKSIQSQVSKHVRILMVGIKQGEEDVQAVYPSVCIVDLKNKKLNYLQPVAESMNRLLEDLHRVLYQYEEMPYVDLTQIEEEKEREQQELAKEFLKITPKITYGLIGVNIIIFVVNLILVEFYDLPILIYMGAKINELIFQGEYHRLLTSMFLHADIMHILLNMFSLYNVGPVTERLFGHKRFLYLYLIAGVGGSISSLMFSRSPGVGASGAIFGIVGMLLYFAQKRPQVFKRVFGTQLFIVIALNLLYGFSVPNIDNAAHIGGMVVGYGASYGVGLYSEAQYTKKKQLLGIGISVIFLYAAFSVARFLPINK